MVEYQVRTAGLSHEENLDNFEGLTRAFGTWTPEEGLTVHAFLSNMNMGGYVLVEADDPAVVLSFVSKYYCWHDIKVIPVIDVAEAAMINDQSVAWVRAAIAD